MANRTMQAKALKLQRQLRKMPRRIENPPGEFTKHSGTAIPARLLSAGLSVGRSPNRELIEGYKHRASSVGVDEETINKMIKLLWGTEYKGIPPGRLEAMERAMKMQQEAIDPAVEKLLRYVKCRFSQRS